MATARIKNYVSANGELVEGWKLKVLRLHMIRELSIKYKVEVIPEIALHSLIDHQNKLNICEDVLREHFGLTTASSKIGAYGSKIRLLSVNEGAFLEATRGIATKPDLRFVDSTLTSEADIYCPLTHLSTPELTYVFENHEEYAFRFCYNARIKRSKALELCVIDKVLEDSADNLSFRNAINSFYMEKAGDISEYVFGKPAPQLNNFNQFHRVPEEGTYTSYHFVGVHEALLPNGIVDLNSAKMEELVSLAQKQVDVLSDTLGQLKALRDSIVEAEASGGVEAIYYERLIDNFIPSIPLLINSGNVKEKELATRLAKKHYY